MIRKIMFHNGYGASIISNKLIYGSSDYHYESLSEVAIINDNGEIVYDTPITNNVISNCTESDIEEILNKIKNLKPKFVTKERQPYIKVMQRRKDSGKQWGMERAFPINTYGIEDAFQMAQDYMIESQNNFGDTLEYKLEGGEE